MKNWLAIIFFLLCTISISAQTELIVELIFEDAAGRQDTTFVGISSNACDTFLNPNLGEFPVDSNFPDSLSFQVIGAKAKQDTSFNSNSNIHQNTFSEKIFFAQARQDNIFRCQSRYQAIVFKCRLNDFPLIIKWNWVNQNNIYDFFKSKAKFNNKLILFTGEDGSMVIEDYDSPGVHLRERDSITFQKEELMPWPETDHDYVLVFYLQQVIVSTENIHANIRQIQAFPNPANTDIRLEMEEPCDQCTIQLYDVNGTLLQARAWQDTDIDITNLPKGMISGLVIDKGIPVASFRFLKMK